MADDGNIIDFTKYQNGETVVEPARRKYKPGDPVLCRHVRLRIYEDQHVIECKDCGAVLSAYNVVMEWARRHRRFRWTCEEERQIRERIEELKKEEQRLKARIRRAKKRAP